MNTTNDQVASFTSARAAAGALIHNEKGQILLVNPAYKPGWEIPGGYIEHGELPSEACHREIREELGIDVQLRNLLVVDWAPTKNDGDKILFVFDSTPLHQTEIESINLETELIEFAFFDVKDIRDKVPSRLHRRISQCCGHEGTNYLENGYRFHWSDPPL